MATKRKSKFDDFFKNLKHINTDTKHVAKQREILSALSFIKISNILNSMENKDHIRTATTEKETKLVFGGDGKAQWRIIKSSK